MSRLRHVDIFVELTELAHDLMDEIRQQLVYYRASVYKDETARLIGGKIDQLRLVGRLLGDDATIESFKDYDAMGIAGAMAVAPGECSFSLRTTALMLDLDRSLKHLGKKPAAQEPEQEKAFTEAVRQHRNQLLALCREGSRQRAFFESL